MSSINIGDKVPNFTLPDQNGNNFDLSSVIGKKNLVIYFYPMDFTPGCTKEACSFRDAYEDFKEANAEVIGISADSPEKHEKFAAQHNLSFILLSDTNRKVQKQFGVGKTLGLLPGRITFIVNKQGVIIHKFNSQFNSAKHVREALEALKKETN